MVGLDNRNEVESEKESMKTLECTICREQYTYTILVSDECIIIIM